jgi:uncharacterized RDD family membrane protein YckC
MNELTITTPEHVEIRLEPAGLGSRFLAMLLDAAVIHGTALTLGRLATLAQAPRGVARAITITATLAIALAWHIWFETRRQGRTPGKRLLRIRVVDARGLPVSLYQSLVRNVMRVIDFAPAFYGIAAISALATKTHRRLGDIVADTLVVRDIQPLAQRAQRSSERRHNTLRNPRVQRMARHRIGLEERELLLSLTLRAEKMAPQARYDLMEEVAAAYRAKLEIDEEGQISGENFVRDLTALLFHPVR